MSEVKNPFNFVKYLIDSYSVAPNMLKFDYVPFSVSVGPDHINNLAMYYPDSKTIIVNSEIENRNNFELIRDIIHEIVHFNQHITWIRHSDFRVDFVKNHKLPKGYHRANLDRLSYEKLIAFWEKEYPYEENPAELQATRLAEKATPRALKNVLKMLENQLEILNKEK